MGAFETCNTYLCRFWCERSHMLGCHISAAEAGLQGRPHGGWKSHIEAC